MERAVGYGKETAVPKPGSEAKSTERVSSSLGWKSFLRMVAGHRPAAWIIVAALILGLGETILSLLIPMLTMNLVDQLSSAGLQGATIVWLVLVFVAQALFSGVSYYGMSYVGQYIIAGLRRRLWQRVLRLPVPYFDRFTSGETMSRVTHDTNVIKDFITLQVIPFVSGLTSIIGALILLLVIDWKMTLLMLLSVPVALLILWPLGAKMFAISKSMQEETAQFQGDLGRVLTEIRLVKSSLAERVEDKQGATRIQNLFRFGLKEAKIQSIVSPAIMTLMLLILVLLIGYGGVRVAENTLTAGALVAILLYMFQIIMPFTQLASFFTQFQKAMGASERVQEILLELPEEEAQTLAASVGSKRQAQSEELSSGKISDEEFLPEKERIGSSLVEVTAFRQSITFDRVHFAYSEDRPILQDLSFTARSGQTTAFVGPSGTGKTTLFSLIERFYVPQSGEIRYGNTLIADIPLEKWRSKIAYVSQESPVMAGTIKDNLLYGLGSVDESKIDDALEQANLTSFIASLPQRLDTSVGERGVKLSGGQRQRLAIARAILRDPDMLLLDEATAHLDSASEQLVQEALAKLMKERTTLVIAHRLSTIRHADQIVVMEDGRVSGSGTHEQLMEEHSFYRKLVKHQFQDENE
ncbi:ABC transporter ATP-binding protein [Paenibacillus senegalensis]|uniref:ABC transporter ATP-binding protein n=1 Tax=Paenibacillus senegalensis TaxID=1465766 RepID=UPI00028825F3|nr:ABC transporter ATP-binding protein [Paenibacillus senegalensis]